MNLPIFTGVAKFSGRKVVGDLLRQKTADRESHEIYIGYYIKTNTDKITNNYRQIVEIFKESLMVSMDNGKTFQAIETTE